MVTPVTPVTFIWMLLLDALAANVAPDILVSAVMVSSVVDELNVRVPLTLVYRYNRAPVTPAELSAA